MKSIDFNLTVADLRKAVAREDASADFLAASYLSWFKRSGPSISLHAWAILDMANRRLFERMLRLRDGNCSSNDTLLELEDEFEFHLKAKALSTVAKLRPQPESLKNGAFERSSLKVCAINRMAATLGTGKSMTSSRLLKSEL